MSVLTAWIIFYGFVALSIILIVAIMIQKYSNRRVLKLKSEARDFLYKKYFDQEEIKTELKNQFFFDAYIDIETHVEIEPEVRARVIADLNQMRFTKRQMRLLNSMSKIKRKIAIFYISTLRTEQSWEMLKKRLYKEKNESVLFYLIFSMVSIIDADIFDLIIKSLEGASENYQSWIRSLMRNHYNQIKNFVPNYFNDTRKEVKKLIIELAGNTIDLELKKYAFRMFHESILEKDITLLSIEAIAKMYPEEIANDIFCKNHDDSIKKVAIRAAASIVNQNMVDNMLNSMNGSPLDEDRTNSLSKIVFDSSDLLLYIIEKYKHNQNKFQQIAIAKVLSHRIDYLMLKLESAGYEYIKLILEDMLKLHIIEDFIDFVNMNRNEKIESLLLPLINQYSKKDYYLYEQFSIYLKESILKKIDIKKQKQSVIPREKSPVERNKVRWIIRWIIFSVLIFPVIFFTFNIRLIFSGNINIFEFFVVSVNRYLVVYFMLANSIYILLLMISVKGAKERIQLWEIKTQILLFEHQILPSISIVAPAYNEEKSIIESVTSLLNLKYPKYEVIVVNDGSKDNTIQVLIDHFELERKHPFFNLKLKTKELRGVYINKQIPNLIVVDKQNGGKADALNLGINVAKNDYVCGIDADSLLEEEALLKLMSVSLDHSTNHIALGGNIVPVNGCIVDKGKIERSGLGKKNIVRFQTLEYLRAFTTGRIGWSKLHSLLIISGAFGLFQRKALLDTGGYLTISGDLKKDTVGEDMELVVRLTYEALRTKKPYRVEYVHHANCYTELPSDLHSLMKQRNRWQRGLLDILSYHRKILLNPRYKQPGMISFPYFFTFEMIGPFLEVIGYLALFTGLFLGILNSVLIIVLLAVTIGFGIVISLFSLYIAERRNVFYSNKETVTLVLVAIIENFGYRQLMSIQRVFSTFSALKESGSWGSQKRQGFQNKQ